MNWAKILLISLVAAAAVGGASHAMTGIAGTHSWHGTEAAALAGFGGGHRDGRHARRRGFDHVCDGRWIEHADEVMAHVERVLDLGPGQAEAWNTLADRLRASGSNLARMCPARNATADRGTALDTLGRAEAMMAAGLETIREVRPALEAFYGVLTGEQRKTLDRLIAGRH